MEGFKTFQSIAVLSAYFLILISSVKSVNGQISTPCTFTMITSFTPCLNFITGSSSNGSLSPTRGCCSSLKSLMSSGMDCACLLVTANVPFQLPINRTLAISLPRACNMNVPIQCKSAGAPLPAPGTRTLMAAGPATLLIPSSPPEADSPFSPRASKVSATAPAPESEATEELTPAASPAIESEGPTTNPGIRPVFGPPASASSLSHVIPSIFLLQIVIGTIVLIM
ncbi:Bifunctional inhibitor/plant lipid transfer protein/seed storage helical domain containing protein [Parasponia andersonii]|uniref:Bifunctional inhibitor/plant lipid transfer protein/seed storage helical domain containing protein n=1 Tax=Parasponia andersonii TaxID=3476 RepID=A0A2P5C2J5_PARAD|nr:Bifunctional inhibitor/plant lipid transfer protein/seed storage helical domain containing protein [Parasponia andersonii]